MALERVRERPKPGDNISDATRQEALRALTASYAAVKLANATHQNECKKWQGVGIKTKISMKVIRDRYKDPAEILAELHEEVRLRALDHMPTVQTDLMDMWKPVEVAPDKRAEHERFRRHDAGAFAAREGHARQSNPHPAGSEAYADWDRGWLEDQTRIARAMGNGAKPIPPADGARAKPARKAAAGKKAAAADKPASGAVLNAGRKRGAARRATTH